MRSLAITGLVTTNLLAVLGAAGVTTSAEPAPLPIVTVEPVGKGTVLLSASRFPPDLRFILPIPPQSPKRVEMSPPEWVDPANKSKVTPFYGISGSGLGTELGSGRAPVHFATVVDRAARKALRLSILLKTSPGFINQSCVGWSGDHLAGIKAAARMHDGRGTEGVRDEKTAVVYLQLPEQDRVYFLFVGYNDKGELIPAFAHSPGHLLFAEYVKQFDQPAPPAKP